MFVLFKQLRFNSLFEVGTNRNLEPIGPGRIACILNKYSPEYKSDEMIIKSLVVELSAQVDMRRPNCYIWMRVVPTHDTKIWFL